MDDEELLGYDRGGCFPGSGESEGEFRKRIDKLKNNFYSAEQIPSSHWDWVRLHLKELFNIEPTFVPAFYSNKGLMPWQGAASWVEGRQLVAVQLREGLKKGSYLGLYRREEILAHEAVHAARAGLESEKWEEFFAYMTSEKRWRRVLGPIVRKPWEVWPLVVFSGVGMVWEIGMFCALGWIVCGLLRLIRGHWILRKASEKILERVKEKRWARAVLVRLTDEEIEKWARGEMMMDDSLRWRAIRLAYFK